MTLKTIWILALNEHKRALPPFDSLAQIPLILLKSRIEDQAVNKK